MKNKITKFSQDPKTEVVSIEQFLEECDYFIYCREKDFWNDEIEPKTFTTYYKITKCLLIRIEYTCRHSMYDWHDIKPNLYKISVAYRDGKTEYAAFDQKIMQLEVEKSKRRKKDEINDKITKLKKSKKRIIKYARPSCPMPRAFESYLIDTGVKTEMDNLKEKYLVFDVETNGLRTANDDLLSLSIYDPTTGICYNRFFPLHLQPLVLTSYINVITDEMLSSAAHLTQSEMDWLYEYFQLDKKILLSFSGGEGKFDYSFVVNYCKRQKINGFKDLKFENIKHRVPDVPYGSEGQLSKDNLCRIFGIDGVQALHSGLNDCILEWKLFEKLVTKQIIFQNNKIYEFTPDYIIPITYLNNNPLLYKYACIEKKNLYGEVKEVYSFSFPKGILNKIKKFGTNIMGIAIENRIKAYLNAISQNNDDFLIANKKKIRFIGSLESKLIEIPVTILDDGTLSAVNPENDVYMNSINEVTNLIMKYLNPICNFMREKIFVDEKIMSQELVISDDKKVLALCDLSDSKNIIEIKTTNVFNEEGLINSVVSRQLYYQSKNRKIYLLHVSFDTHAYKNTGRQIIDNLNVFLYEVKLISEKL